MKVFDNETVKKQVHQYQIQKQYLKACRYIEQEHFRVVNFKLREPKHLQVYQFRITKKYRAFALKRDTNIIVYKISDHQ